MTLLILTLLGCWGNRCPELDTGALIIDGVHFEVSDAEGPPTLQGAALAVEGDELVMEYEDPELGPVRLRYRIASTEIYPY